MTDIKILIVDGRKQTLSGLKKLIDVEDGMSVAGTASSGEEAIQVLVDVQPSVILMGGKLPDMRGIDATEALKSIDMYVQIVLLAVDPGFELMRKAMRARIRVVIPAPPESQVLYKAILGAHEHYDELKALAPPVVSSNQTSVDKPRWPEFCHRQGRLRRTTLMCVQESIIK